MSFQNVYHDRSNTFPPILVRPKNRLFDVDLLGLLVERST